MITQDDTLLASCTSKISTQAFLVCAIAMLSDLAR
jgi:hypothetical protein